MGNLRLAFAPDGKSIAYAGGADPEITLCAVPSGKTIRTFGKQTVSGNALLPVITSLDISPDGNLLAAAESGAKTLQVVFYDMKKSKRLTEVTGKPLTGNGAAPNRGDELRALRFSPDGAYLAWCGSTGVVVVKVGEFIL
jgi:WD40 repeat protein